MSTGYPVSWIFWASQSIVHEVLEKLNSKNAADAR